MTTQLSHPVTFCYWDGGAGLMIIARTVDAASGRDIDVCFEVREKGLHYNGSQSAVALADLDPAIALSAARWHRDQGGYE
jgi:hypothetical protein